MNKRKGISLLLAQSIAIALLCFTGFSAQAGSTAQKAETFLSDLEWESQSWGSRSEFPNGTGKDTAIDGGAIRLQVDGQERQFDKGLGTHAPSEIVYDIGANGYESFQAYVGVDLDTLDDYNANNAEGIIANFIVKADGVMIAQSGEMNPAMDAHYFDVAIPAGTSRLTLVVEPGTQTWSDWADWADARFIGGDPNAVKEEGPTIAPIEGNNVRVSMDKGVLQLFRGDTLIAVSDSQGMVVANGRTISDFAVSSYEVQSAVQTLGGEAERLVLEMGSASSGMEKTLWIDLLKDIDGAIVTTTFLEAQEDMTLTEIVENEFSLFEPDADRIWSYNGGGEGRQSFYDTLQKVSNSFYRENRQDETAAAIPVSDIYSVNGGVTVGDGALYRRFLTTPVSGGSNTAKVSIHWKNESLEANVKTEVGTAIVSVHDGDYYNGLRTYAEVMAARGFAVPDYVPDSSYDLRWESWGWEGAWTIDKILGKLDALYAQGIRQITLDDCWYTSPGDWQLNPDKFPNGVEDMKRLTDAVHAKGMTIVLWWRPMDGGRENSFSVLAGFTQQKSVLLEEHPEYFVKNEDGTFAMLSGPGSRHSFNGSTGYALCPQSEGAVENQREFVRRAMTEWGIDGFKSDYVWGMPKCYDGSHNHVSPQESTETASNIFYEAIYDEMVSIDPEGFHLLCNCGTPQDYYSFPYVTQIPTADPTSVDQTRRRVKAYKALSGDDFPITTDHNEIWYPSSVGTGAVLIEKRDFAVGSAQEAEYYRWLGIADEHDLHKGTHIGDLYSYGIDPYETYVIEKDGMMYYSFYRDGKYKPTGNPQITLKGLNPSSVYRIEDYVNNRVLAENVSGSDAVLSETFSEYLLVRAVKIVNLTGIIQPTAIADIANGTALADIVLPSKVTIQTTEGNMEADVIWDRSITEPVYESVLETEQTFTLAGSVALPEGVGNPDHIELTTRISITVAEKVPEAHTITAGAGTGGKISPAGNVAVAHGTDQAFRITADGGYEIEDVMVDGKSVGAVASYTFDNVTDSHTITASFKKVEAPPEHIHDWEAGWRWNETHHWHNCGEAACPLTADSGKEGYGVHVPGPAATQATPQTCSVCGYEIAPALGNGQSGGQGQGAPEEPWPFTDVEEIAGHWKYDNIKYVWRNKIMNGISGTTLFRPDHSLTRAMFATVLYRMAEEPEVAFTAQFSDVEPGIWYSDAIIWANREGIVDGYSDGSYGINDDITREQIAKMLFLYGEAQGYDVGARASLDSFTDKDSVSTWAVGYLQWAVDAKMIGGKPNEDGSYRLDPRGQATRAECAKMLRMFLEKYQ